ncbi:uncharacterized protein SPPG_03775 [Spizellomyces punctatus DAOM BR117]|uniref:25S rRNA (uridine-N(3))-methyltransferase BMT5-like domain-containing protein n=1 Tax=Spizellomyces punctatus (strain DAOM BR117) TaxID=645134 RepID=A0A0L0HIF3_SPIPD|nr:uncharacterized protein SPPG_03775 [Spizellomyces punctatus DAOM BR117]KND00650.1 hypothetical protein SPPG_03775 [Spizellomyces punctatus DAOM BR117]|eukprot:XP_016608689.1 hypothetical protein SPPG_03775 [Spizellomyces punctatus DAOM BR117]
MGKRKSRPHPSKISKSTAPSQRFPTLSSLTRTELLLQTLRTSQPSNPAHPFKLNQRILLIGEGDFSYARALATSLGKGQNIIATSFDTKPALIQKYPHVQTILGELVSSGVTILHNVDATALTSNSRLSALTAQNKFDRIVFQFPHVGGSQQADVEQNRALLSNFFAQAQQLMNANGEIHVTLRDTPFYRQWSIEDLALKEGLAMKQRVPFEGERMQALGYTPQRTHPAVRDAPTLENAFVHVFEMRADKPATKKKEDIPSHGLARNMKTASASTIPKKSRAGAIGKKPKQMRGKRGTKR